MKEYKNAQRTKKWIRDAFSELMAEKKSIEKITVTELAERADISKTTFYYHYPDIYAVAEEFEDEIITALSDTLDGLGQDDYSEDIRRILDFLRANEETYRR
ncbi:MAG TPA: TetR/AcrR family transcriptional regulator, partial [Clostridiales bacterium]|nr:TetR/AcrR family transcriptional regulator [Clostridiales bacterium]